MLVKCNTLHIFQKAKEILLAALDALLMSPSPEEMPEEEEKPEEPEEEPSGTPKFTPEEIMVSSRLSMY